MVLVQRPHEFAVKTVTGGSHGCSGNGGVAGMYGGEKRGGSSGSPWWMALAGFSLSFFQVGQATSILLCPCLFVQNQGQADTTVGFATMSLCMETGLDV